MSPRQFQDVPHTDRAPRKLGVPETKFAWRPSVHFGTPFTRNVPHREFHVRPHWEDSHKSPPAYFSSPLKLIASGSSTDSPRDKVRIAPLRPYTPDTDRAPQGAPPTAPERRSRGVPPPISAHPSPGSRSIGSSTDGLKRRGRMASLRIFRHTPDADRAPQGAPPMAPTATSHGVPTPISAHASRGSCSSGLEGRLEAIWGLLGAVLGGP